MVEGARLESVCASNRTVSSNLILSAMKKDVHLDIFFHVEITTRTRGCQLADATAGSAQCSEMVWYEGLLSIR